MRRRRLVLLALSVALAWIATATLGIRAAEAAVMSRVCGRYEVARVSSIGDVDSGPAIAMNSFAIAPFVVRVEYDYIGFIWCGEGAVADVLWFPGLAQVLRKHVHWVS